MEASSENGPRNAPSPKPMVVPRCRGAHLGSQALGAELRGNRRRQVYDSGRAAHATSGGMRAFLPAMGSVLSSIVVLASSQGCSSSSNSAPSGNESAADAASQGDAPATREGGAEAGSASPDFRSGSRLRAMTYVAAGGTKLFTGFYDSELKQRCTFATADDGSMRCLPVPSGAVVFTDAACTKPVLIFDDPCADAPLPYTRLADATTACMPKRMPSAQQHPRPRQRSHAVTMACVPPRPHVPRPPKGTMR